jgi:hypothetical protein
MKKVLLKQIVIKADNPVKNNQKVKVKTLQNQIPKQVVRKVLKLTKESQQVSKHRIVALIVLKLIDLETPLPKKLKKKKTLLQMLQTSLIREKRTRRSLMQLLQEIRLSLKAKTLIYKKRK